MRMKFAFAILGVALLSVVAFFWRSDVTRRNLPVVTYSQFLDSVRAGEVSGVVVMADGHGAKTAILRMKQGRDARTVLPSDFRDALRAMQDQRVDIEIRDGSRDRVRMLINATPFLVLLVVWLILFTDLSSSGRRRIFLGRS